MHVWMDRQMHGWMNADVCMYALMDREIDVCTVGWTDE